MSKRKKLRHQKAKKPKSPKNSNKIKRRPKPIIPPEIDPAVKLLKSAEEALNEELMAFFTNPENPNEDETKRTMKYVLTHSHLRGREYLLASIIFLNKFKSINNILTNITKGFERISVFSGATNGRVVVTQKMMRDMFNPGSVRPEIHSEDAWNVWFKEKLDKETLDFNICVSVFNFLHNNWQKWEAQKEIEEQEQAGKRAKEEADKQKAEAAKAAAKVLQLKQEAAQQSDVAPQKLVASDEPPVEQPNASEQQPKIAEADSADEVLEKAEAETSEAGMPDSSAIEAEQTK